ncbi:MAG: DNA repair protein RecO [Desulfurivibrio sp.]|jgi:DNA repair protein RecO (recombination protein O)|nr:MAG: DNA repair protein RecO [Desulfurivibrio sp.]
MSFLQSRAIVLKVTDYGESDKIVICYTQHFGKLKAIAKGAKRSKKRFVNKLEFFSLLDITIVPGRFSSLGRIDNASLVNPFPPLRENYHCYTAAMLVCELVDQWTRENDSDEPLFQLLCWCLHQLATRDSLAETVIFFQIKMLDLLGMGLMLEHCLVCGTLDPAAPAYYFSPAQSGIICSRCRTSDTGLIPLSMAAIKSMQMARSLPLARLHRLKISGKSLSEAATALRLYGNFQLQREIHSWKQFHLV